MEKERDGPRVAPEPTMRSDMEDMPELSDTMMALEDESDELVNVPEVRSDPSAGQSELGQAL